jgi:heme/copper-type cytochrome/quinol oxidase subunit 1
MSSRRLYDKVMTIVGTMMIFFYLGIAYILLFTTIVPAEKPMRVIFSVPLLLYGVYRINLSYHKIKENFFEEDED